MHIGLLVCSKFRSTVLFSLTGLAPRSHHPPNNFRILLKPRSLNWKTNKTSTCFFSFKIASVQLDKLHIPRKHCTSLDVTARPKNANAWKVHFQTRVFSQITHENLWKLVQDRSNYSQGFFPAVYPLYIEPPVHEIALLCTRKLGFRPEIFRENFRQILPKYL